MDGSESTSARVSWEAVDDADYYTVSFSAAVGDDQEGLCRDGSHSASVTVGFTQSSGAEEDIRSANGSNIDRLNASITVREDVGSANGSTIDRLNASITVREDVGSNDTSSLRAYTTYSVTVVAFSDRWGKTVGSNATRLATSQQSNT